MSKFSQTWLQVQNLQMPLLPRLAYYAYRKNQQIGVGVIVGDGVEVGIGVFVGVGVKVHTGIGVRLTTSMTV